MAQQRRILKEVQSGMSSSLFQFMYDSDGEFGDRNVAYVKFTITSGAFRDQTHLLQFKFTYGNNQVYQFPRDPPNVLFETPIFHPNIATSGSICLDVIKDKWSSMYGIEAIFNSIIALLDEPNLASPFNSSAAQLYREHPGAGFGSICQEYYQQKMESGEYERVKQKMNAPRFSRGPA